MTKGEDDRSLQIDPQQIKEFKQVFLSHANQLKQAKSKASLKSHKMMQMTPQNGEQQSENPTLTSRTVIEVSRASCLNKDKFMNDKQLTEEKIPWGDQQSQECTSPFPISQNNLSQINKGKTNLTRESDQGMYIAGLNCSEDKFSSVARTRSWLVSSCHV